MAPGYSVTLLPGVSFPYIYMYVCMYVCMTVAIMECVKKKEKLDSKQICETTSCLIKLASQFPLLDSQFPLK